MRARSKRVGKTRTFGISVDAETEEFLRQEAEDRFEGNVSRLVTALAREEMSRRAAEWLLVHSRNYKPMTVEETRAFLAKFTQTRKRRKKSAAA
jgi:hypothetical protein